MGIYLPYGFSTSREEKEVLLKNWGQFTKIVESYKKWSFLKGYRLVSNPGWGKGFRVWGKSLEWKAPSKAIISVLPLAMALDCPPCFPMKAARQLQEL